MLLDATPSPSHWQRKLRESAFAAYEARCERLLDRYFDTAAGLDDFCDHLRALYPHNYGLMMNNLLRVNLVRKVVDTKARLYRKPPQRLLRDGQNALLPPDAPECLRYSRLIRQTRLNAKMKWLLRLTELLNASVLWGQMDFARRLPSLSVLAPHQLIVTQDPQAPSDLQRASEILVPVGGAPDSPLAKAAEVLYLRYRLQRDAPNGPRLSVVLCDGAFLPLPTQPPELSAYGRLTRYPFALLRKIEPQDAELFPDVPESLLLAADWIDHELTRGALNARQVDFPAYTFNGTPEELGGVNPVMGAGSVLCLGEDGKELAELPVNAREEERNANILFFLKLFAQMNELAPSSFSLDATPLSGIAKFYDKQPEIEYREDWTSLLAPFEEEDVFDLLADLLLIYEPEMAQTIKSCALGVTFNEPLIPLAREEELANLKSEFGLGLRSPVEVLAEQFGLDRESAEGRVKENAALYRELCAR